MSPFTKIWARQLMTDNRQSIIFCLKSICLNSLCRSKFWISDLSWTIILFHFNNDNVKESFILPKIASQNNVIHKLLYCTWQSSSNLMIFLSYQDNFSISTSTTGPTPPSSSMNLTRSDPTSSRSFTRTPTSSDPRSRATFMTPTRFGRWSKFTSINLQSLMR